MNPKNNLAPSIDIFIENCQHNKDVTSKTLVEKLLKIIDLMSVIKIQGEDELRSIWLMAKRGSIEDFGDFDDFLENEEVSNFQEFEELWNYYYPDEIKWYSFTITRYSGVYYFFFDSKLTFQFKTDDSEVNNVDHYEFQANLADWLMDEVESNVKKIKTDINKYNQFISDNLPFKKRLGRILRSDLWSIFPDLELELREKITPEKIEILKKVCIDSNQNNLQGLKIISANDFFKICEVGYDANQYFDNKFVSPKEKYISMADGRDCGLTKIDEFSTEAFENWYKNERYCGGHPWEICRGGNSTHISLYVCHDDNGWYVRLEGCSWARFIETILMAVAFYEQKIPFILGKANEICKMAQGNDFIGIVPETITPRYCQSIFPSEDKIIDFMNLGYEQTEEIIKHTYWYPLNPVELSDE